MSLDALVSRRSQETIEREYGLEDVVYEPVI